ncbi:MAG: S41 family peptidase [Fulvivirga sp.]
MKSSIRNILIGVLAILIVAFASPSDKYFSIAKNLDIFASLFREVNSYYVDDTDPEQLTKIAIEAMLESLDPYTNYIPEEDAEAFMTSTTGEYAGIGAQIAIIDNEAYISMLYKGFAAERAGIQVGDKIVKANGSETINKSVSEISAILKGRARSKAQIQIIRSGVKDTLSFDVVREKITVNNVPYFGLIEDTSIGYILLDDFTTGAGKEVGSAVKSLKSDGAKAVILDLRNNLGGLLSEAVNVSNVFIPKNRVVVSTRGRIEEWNRTYKTLDGSIDDQIPLAVLVNGESASAAEIVAGVMQDYDRAVLIGTQTFGKGLVQTSRPLTYNNRVKITTARYYIPSGRCIQELEYGDHANDTIKRKAVIFKTKAGRDVYDRGGLMPDILVEEPNVKSITVELFVQGLLFKYANYFHSQHPSTTFDASQFSNFKTWLNNNNFEYYSPFNQSIDSLYEMAKAEKQDQMVLDNILKLKKPLNETDTELEEAKHEITRLVRQELGARKELQAGEIKSILNEDEAILISLKMLRNQDHYKKLLSSN